MASSEKMEMEMGNCFPPIGSVIDYQAVTRFIELELTADALRGEEELAENRAVLGRNRSVPGMVLFRDNQDMNGGLGGGIAEGNGMIILIDDVSGHLAINDALEYRLGHGADYQMVSSSREGLRFRARARMKWTISSLSFWQEVRHEAEPVRARTQERSPSSRRAEAREETFSSRREASCW